MNSSQADARIARLVDVSLQPLAARPHPERRNLVDRSALLGRISGEFDEMPGTSLTLSQATRLFGVDAQVCDRILSRLVEEGRLRKTVDGRYRLRSTAA